MKVTGNFTIKVDPKPNPLAVQIAVSIPDAVEGTDSTSNPIPVAKISGGVPPYIYGNVQGVPPGMNLGGNKNDDGTESLFLVGQPNDGDSQTNGGVYQVSFDVTDSQA